MLTLVDTPAPPANDSGTYFRLDDDLRPVECNRADWEAFRATGAASVATTNIGGFASVVTTFEGIDDGFGDPDDPHFFMTMIHRDEHSEAEGHRTWQEAEAAHRLRVDELKAMLERRRRSSEPQLDLP